jgi:hypothetical protein
MPETEDPEGEIEELEDRSMPVERMLWSIRPPREGQPAQRIERTYTQKGLMWFGKIELYGLLGQAVRVVLEGDNPMGIGNLMDFAQNPQQMVNDLVGNLPGAEDAPDRDDSQDMEVEAGKVLAAFAEVVAKRRSCSRTPTASCWPFPRRTATGRSSGPSPTWTTRWVRTSCTPSSTRTGA